MESFSPQFHTTLVVLFPTIIVFYYLSRKISTKNLAPEAGGAWPIIGHLHLVGGSKLSHIVYGSMADKYGPIFTVRLGIHRYLVVSSWEMMKELFTVNDVFVSNRPKSIATDHLSFGYAMFGFLPISLLWAELRKITSAHLLSGTRLEQFKHVRASETEISMKQLYRLWSEKKDASGRFLVADAMKWFGELNLNVILRMLAGKRYSGDEKEARRVRRMTREFFRLIVVVTVADSFPFLRWLDLGGYEKEMKETAREMDTIVGGWLEEHKSKSNVSSHQPEDFMDFLLSSVHNLDLCGFDADTIIKATCMIILSGGYDTIAVAQTWSLTMLLINREVLEKAQEVLDSVVGKGRQVQESDLHNLVYLDAIIKETLRLDTPGQMSGPREFTENCTVAGVTRLIFDTKFAVLSGATDTTTVTLIWALSLLLNNRYCLKKAQDELDLHVGRERQVKDSDIQNLVYLQTITKETLRLYPAAPLGIPHEAMENCVVHGYNVPKGTRLFVNIWKIQHDPLVWPDANEFKPERFLTSHKDVNVRGQHFELIPFGSGRRMCPGMSFGLQAVQMTLASLIHGFDTVTTLNEAVDMRESFGIINQKATPLEVLLSPRLPPYLYA